MADAYGCCLTLNETTRLDLLAGPRGVLDLTHSHDEQLDDRRVRAGGSVFRSSPTYTVKLEGAAITGYHAKPKDIVALMF